MFIVESHIIQSLHSSTRFEEYCRGLFSQFPSNKSVKKAIKKGALRLNGDTVESGRYVQINDKIEVWDLEEKPPLPFPLKIDIVFEDEHFAVVNKPAGLVTSGNQFETLENCVQGQVKISNHKDALLWPRPVHRLDSATGGLVIISKSIPAHIALGEMLSNKTIRKFYHAVTQGNWPDHLTDISVEINGKAAETKVNKLKTTLSLRNKHLSLLQLSPLTGRTHQLRIHTSVSGHPIVGDMLYAEKGKTLEHKGLFLCAVKLEMNHPITQEPISVSIPTPPKFLKLMEREEVRYHKFNKS